jgi:hypothetical protein
MTFNLKLSKPHSIQDVFFLMLGAFFAISGPYGQFDIARYQVDVCHACGLYSLPFAFEVPWYLAEDLFIALTFIGAAMFILAFIDVDRNMPSFSKQEISEIARSLADMETGNYRTFNRTDDLFAFLNEE